MQVQWDSLYSGSPGIDDGAPVTLDGFAFFSERDGVADTFLLLREPACCAGHLPPHPWLAVEILADTPQRWRPGPVRISGVWQSLHDDAAGWCYRIRSASLTPLAQPREGWGLSRRGFLSFGAMAGLTACAGPQAAAYSENPDPEDPAAAQALADTLAWMRDSVTIDMHSHAGRMSLGRRPKPRPFSPLAAPMQAGGMDVVCMAIVTDSAVTHIVDTESGRRRIVAYRDPAPGEMATRGEASFARLRELATQQQLNMVTSAGTLARARLAGPSIVIAAEGADFLEGDIRRLDRAYMRHGLRHLQLTHYRVNELGDIQTAPPVHHGLTRFGEEVVQRCNQLGIVVDVAHGTYDLVKRAAQVSSKPLVLSHTSLTSKPAPFGRAITAEHARLVASTGGVIGVWPVATTFPDLAAMARGIRRMANVVGVDHVGVGSDMLGLLTPSVLDSYRKLPHLAQALVDAKFARTEVAMILGGNYARVFAASMAI
jgi:membrane dipeptidase